MSARQTHAPGGHHAPAQGQNLAQRAAHAPSLGTGQIPALSAVQAPARGHTLAPAYAGIDRFRIVAALLVVAVHTSPLLSLGELPDFLFTRVLARLAVPFFFAATGFFLLAPYTRQREAGPAPVLRFLRKTALLYGLAVLLYLPLNLYAGHFDAIKTPWQAIKLLLVDGTVYHLWYLPAALLGVPLVWALLRWLGPRLTAGIAAGLYLIGLLGDSYFGLAQTVPVLNSLYKGLFAVGSYTRNGLFYAPIFLLVGVLAARRPRPAGRAAALCLLAALAALFAEGLLLHTFGAQRHDSMYILLPLCVFLLMRWLAGFTRAADAHGKALRDVSMAVYLLHPWAIVLLRGAAKPLGLTALLVNNSVVHYLAVCALSLGVALAFALVKGHLRAVQKQAQAPKRAWVEVDLNALLHNAEALQGRLPAGCRLMPVLKADAYGLGAAPIAKALHSMGVRQFCVACLSEGIALRRQGVRGQILVLGYTHPSDARLLKRYRLAQTVVDCEHGRRLAQQGVRIKVHLKVDTGMHRLGERSERTVKLARLFTLKNLNIQGIFTQLSRCDNIDAADIAATRQQIESFEATLRALQKQGLTLPKTHVQCSYGILNYPDVKADYARPGLALYGIVDQARCLAHPPALHPVFTVKARVALVKTVYRGEGLGYGGDAVAKADMRVAVVTMGYADGLPRCLSHGAGHVLIEGRPAPFVGAICMDQAIVDVSHIEGLQAGGEAVVLGHSGRRNITVEQLAAAAGTIPNEIVSRLSARVERRHLC